MTAGGTACYRHGDRPAGVICQRCDRPICPSCMHQASVGFHCPECVKGQGKQKVIHRATSQNSLLGKPPVVTTVLLAVNIAVFVIGGVIDARSMGTRVSSFSADFALYGPCVNGNEWYRLVTGGFLHAGVIHLLFNMLSLYQVGPIVEGALGRARFVTLYFVSLLGGSAGAILLDPNRPVVGASGAIFGLLGALFVLQKAMGINPWHSGVASSIGLNLLITFSIPFISKGGHLGGLVAGALCAYAIIELPRRLRDPQASYYSVALLPLLFVAGILIARSASLPSFAC